MKKLFLFLALILFFVVSSNINAQVGLIVCERYDSQYGIIGEGVTFTKGYLTVVATSAYPINYTDVYIQFDRYNANDGQYYFYKQFAFTIPYGYRQVYFSRVGNNDMQFDHAGYYIIWLLDLNNNVIAKTTVTIVD